MIYMSFNNYDFKDLFIVESVGRPILPPQSIIKSEPPGKHGSRQVRKKHESYSIPVVGSIYVPKKEMLRPKIRELAAKLYTTKAEKLVFSDEPHLYYMASLSGNTDLEKVVSLISKGTLLFDLDGEPYAYGDDKTIRFSNSINIDYKATAPTKPVVEIVFTANRTNFEISNGVRTVKLLRQFTSGDRVTIDFSTEKVVFNNEISMMLLDWRSRFFELSPGMNQITVSSGAEVTLKYPERWL